jgi:hypothetical protein
VEASVRRALQGEGGELHVVWGGTLYHMEDLPFQLGAMPASYGDFRDKLKAVAVRWGARWTAQVLTSKAGSARSKPNTGCLPACLAGAGAAGCYVLAGWCWTAAAACGALLALLHALSLGWVHLLVCSCAAGDAWLQCDSGCLVAACQDALVCQHAPAVRAQASLLMLQPLTSCCLRAGLPCPPPLA